VQRQHLRTKLGVLLAQLGAHPPKLLDLRRQRIKRCTACRTHIDLHTVMGTAPFFASAVDAVPLGPGTQLFLGCSDQIVNGVPRDA
jgi:hypothetical protein